MVHPQGAQRAVLRDCPHREDAGALHSSRSSGDSFRRGRHRLWSRGGEWIVDGVWASHHNTRSESAGTGGRRWCFLGPMEWSVLLPLDRERPDPGTSAVPRGTALLPPGGPSLRVVCEMREVEVAGDGVRVAVRVASLRRVTGRRRERTADPPASVPSVTTDWLPAPDNGQNPVRRFAFPLLQPLVAPQRPLGQESKPCPKSVIELALEFQRLLNEGVVNTRAEIARQYGLSRARVTQVLNVLLLPPQVLDALSDRTRLDGVSHSERRLRRILALASEEAQLAAVRGLQTDGG